MIGDDCILKFSLTLVFLEMQSHFQEERKTIYWVLVSSLFFLYYIINVAS